MVVMKFGGTSVADRAAIERLMAIVRAERQAEAQQEGGDARGPIVVVSALSGVTDRLLGVAAQAGAGDTEGARSSLRDLHQRHITVSEVVTDPALRAQTRGRTGARVRRNSSASSRRWRCCARCRRAGWTPLPPPARSSAAASSPPRSPPTRCRRRWVDARQAVVTDGEHTAAAPQFPGNHGGADDARGSAAGRRAASR